MSTDLDAIEAGIPDAAVETAAMAMLDKMYDDKTLRVDDEDRDIARAALEAANLPLLAMVRDQQATIERVREMHRGNRWGYCEACSEHVDVPMPCPTIAALTATEGKA